MTEHNAVFDTDQKELLSSLCQEYNVPFDLVARMLEVERQSTGMTRRAGVQRALQAVLSQEWESESDIMETARERQKERIWFGLE